MNKLVISEIEMNGKRVNCDVEVREYSVQGSFVSMFVVGDVCFNTNDIFNVTFGIGHD